MAAKSWRVAALVSLLLVATGWSTQLYLYWRTDKAYEKLVAARPQNRVEVEATLTGFRGVHVLDPEAMQPLLRDKLRSEREYWRYTKWPGFSIDAVYEADGSVYSLWPDYE